MLLTGTAAQNSLSVLRVHPTEPDGSQGVVSPEKHPARGEGIVRKGKGLGKDTNLQIQALLFLWETEGLKASQNPNPGCSWFLHPTPAIPPDTAPLVKGSDPSLDHDVGLSSQDKFS